MFPIALANQKGGVGKTTNAINLSGALADRGYDVLAADFDPQGYLSTTLGFEERYREGSVTLADALRDPSGIDADRLVADHPEFDVLPATASLRGIVRQLTRREDPAFGTVRRTLEAVAGGRYDFVVADTPPVQNALTDLLIADCGDVFVPMGASEPSIYSVGSLVDRILDLEREAEAGIRIRAILLSNVNYPLDNEQKRVQQWVEDNFGGQCPVYEIRHRAAIQRSLKAGGSIFAAGAEPTDMTEVYADIAAQVERLDPAARPGGEA